MQNIIAVFKTRDDAVNAGQELLNRHVPERDITLLSLQPSGEQSRDEGMGKTMGSYVGGVVGAGSGLTLGTAAAASLMVPGVGPVLAIGFGAAALLGIGGAVAGHAVGDATEDALTEEHTAKAVPRGPSSQETARFHDLLKQGRSILIVHAESDEIARTGAAVLERYGTRLEDAA